MLKIGFIDYFLDEWHSDNYPAWVRQQAAALGIDAAVIYAWAEIDKPGGMNNPDWCAKHQIELCSTVEDLVEKSDALIVLSPDHSEHHERLGRPALISGKPVYMDKTFSPDLASGVRMFDLAAAYKTPLFSASALRFAIELTGKSSAGDASFLNTTGPGAFSTYAVHQVEMIVALLGSLPLRLMALIKNNSRQIVIEYPDAIANMWQMPGFDFQVTLARTDGNIVTHPCSGYFENLIGSIITFFADARHSPPVSRDETLACMAILDAGRAALAEPGSWVDISNVR